MYVYIYIYIYTRYNYIELIIEKTLAKWSVIPDTLQCIVAPPSSSPVTTSPRKNGLIIIKELYVSLSEKYRGGGGAIKLGT